MSISDNYVPIRQLGNGSTTQFSGNWAVLAAAYLTVFYEAVSTGVQTPVSLSDYSLVFNNSGFTVTFNTAPTSSNYVIIGRDVAFDQTDPYRTSTGFQGEVIEASFDKITAICQDLNDVSNRSLKFPLGSTAIGVLPVPVDDAIIAWSGTGGNVKNGPTTASFAVATATAVAAATTATTEAGIATSAATTAVLFGGIQNYIHSTFMGGL